MNSSAPKNDNGSAQVVKTATRQRNLYRLWAVVFIGLGLLLLARNLGALPSGFVVQAISSWPVLVILAGLFLVWTGRAPIGLAPSAFAIDRGTYQEGHLQLDAGRADVRVGAFVGTSQFAVGQFSGHAGPRLRAEGSKAYLILDHHAVVPFMLGEWSVSLAKGLPWTISLRSNVGHLHLNLRDLAVPRLSLRSLFGEVDMTLPSAGQGEMDLRLTFGDLAVRVPEGVGIKLKLIAGPLTQATIVDRRLIQMALTEWITPNFSSYPQRFTLTVTLLTGDLLLA